MNKYEENYTVLRDLNEGDEFIDKSNSVGIYLKSLGDDKYTEFVDMNMDNPWVRIIVIGDEHKFLFSV